MASIVAKLLYPLGVKHVGVARLCSAGKKFSVAGKIGRILIHWGVQNRVTTCTHCVNFASVLRALR